MKQLEFRLQPDVVLPLLSHVRPLIEEMDGKLASNVKPPDEDAMLADFWQTDLLAAQRRDLKAVTSFFEEPFSETGRAVLDVSEADLFMRGCAALRLKLRETSLRDLSDSQLEGGEVDYALLTDRQRLGYGAYMLFASLQELIISQLDRLSGGWGPEDDDEGGDELA